MWSYSSYYPDNVNKTFTLAGRVNDLFAMRNVHEHRNNYSRHSGLGSGHRMQLTAAEQAAIEQDHAFMLLPHANQAGSPYTEIVFSLPGQRVGATRLIVNEQHNWNEIYFTDTHYKVYWIVIPFEQHASSTKSKAAAAAAGGSGAGGGTSTGIQT